MKPPGTFGTSNNQTLIEKWRPMLEAQGITDPYKQAWMADYCENHMKFDKEQQAKGISVISEGVREIVGSEAAEKMEESLSFTEPGIRLPDLDNDREAIDAWDDIEVDPPNDALTNAAEKYKESTKLEPVEKPGLFRRILNWFKS